MEKSRKEWCLILFCLMLGVVAAVVQTVPGKKEREEQKKIAESVLRFHVRANSDSREDQAEKLRVRDAVLDILQEVSQEDDTKDQVKDRIRDHRELIRETAEKVAFPHKAKVSLVWDRFPEKRYGDCTFPAGWYEALRIDIGEAKGHNWWCVLYPGLCYTHGIDPVVPDKEKEKLRSVLDGETYDFIMHPEKARIKFRWLRFLNLPYLQGALE